MTDPPRFADTKRLADELMRQYSAGEIDGVYVAYMNFISTGSQKPDVAKFLPLASIHEVAEQIGRQVRRRKRRPRPAHSTPSERRERHRRGRPVHGHAVRLLPQRQGTVRRAAAARVPHAFFQTYLDAATSEHVARMVAMKSATDAADKMVSALTHAVQPRPPEPDHDRAVGDHGRRGSDEGIGDGGVGLGVGTEVLLFASRRPATHDP
jgi:F-type H+-transporting ATPase subunit gamma